MEVTLHTPQQEKRKSATPVTRNGVSGHKQWFSSHSLIRLCLKSAGSRWCWDVSQTFQPYQFSKCQSEESPETWAALPAVYEITMEVKTMFKNPTQRTHKIYSKYTWNTSCNDKVNSEEQKQIMQLMNSANCACAVKNNQELIRKNGDEIKWLQYLATEKALIVNV